MPGEHLSKDLSLSEFRQFRDYIHDHSGIYLEETKLDSLRISLVTRATRLECDSWEQYFERLSTDDAEFRELMSLVTINETSFFRFPAQFDVLRTHVLPEIASNARSEKRTMRLWSAGCSTGEEPYSLAMTYADSGLDGLGWKGEIVGTDVSTKALNVARQAVYPSKALLNVPEATVARHFIAEPPDTLRIAPHIRRLCDFHYHNLIKEPYPLALMGNWDVIFCRNVTIYFKLESTRRVVSNFYRSLNEGGYLFIGHSETLSSISDDFDVTELGGVFVYRKPVRAVRAFSLGGLSERRGTPRARAGQRRPTEASEGGARPFMERKRSREEAVPGPSPAAPQTEEPVVTKSADQLVAEAREMLNAGRSEPALAAVEAALAADANNADAYLLAAHLNADKGDYERALTDCTRALSINPLLPGARYILGVIYQRQGDLVRSISELKKTIYIDPDFALAHMNLGNIYKSQGKFEAACREYENALRSLYKNPTGAWTLYLGGWQADVILKTCERSLLECRKAMGVA
jgi:chemotaxis protein methyltransferase CheR